MQNAALSYFKTHSQDFLSQLIEFIKIPSISTDSERAADVQNAAKHIARKLTDIGIEHVEVFPTVKHPIVYGEYLHAGAEQPTVLIYGHYDVQPIDPVELWTSSAFEPELKGDELFARGASDMKGQVFASVAAVESILKSGTFPINIKFILEGEEEIGSPHFKDFLVKHKDLLKADIALNPDSGMLSKDQPAIVYGLRGMSYMEINVYGPTRDLHSGLYGGAIHNPAQVLCELISKMHDTDGRITLPGFYDRVIPLSEEERQELSRQNLNDQYFCEQTGVAQLWGEKGYTALERAGARPTLEVNGFLSGFTGEGSKTIIPAKAMAKISTRLVPNQKPEEVMQQMKAFLNENAPATVRWDIKEISTGSPSLSDITLPETKAMFMALQEVWGVDPIYKREGGSISVVADMQEVLGIDSVLTGFGLPDDNIHSPNEKLDLPTWHKGVQALIHFFFNSRRP